MAIDRDIANEICLRMLDGESLKRICQDEHMPSRRTVFRWLVDDEDFRQEYELPREMLGDLLFDEIKDIADDARNDFMERLAADGTIERTPDHENIHRSKLRVETRKWMASKLIPKRYGDKLDVEVKAGGGLAAELAAARRRVSQAADSHAAEDYRTDTITYEPPSILALPSQST